MLNLAKEATEDLLLEHDFAQLKTIEPWWKLLLESKAMLPFLWQMFPNHPSILPAYYNNPNSQIDAEVREKYDIDIDRLWVSKPIFGSDGEDILRSDSFSYGSRSYTEFVKATKEKEIYEGDMRTKGFIYQQLSDLPVV